MKDLIEELRECIQRNDRAPWSILTLMVKAARTLEDQVLEIERLQLTCNDLDDQNDRIYAELAALKTQPASAGDEQSAFEAAYLKANYPRVHSGELSAPPIFVKTKAGEYDDPDMERTWIMWQARAALKTKPSGVVQWPDADEIMQMAFEEGQPSDDASGYYFELEEFDLFIQRLMEEVAHLNQPASAGDEPIRYWFIGDVGQEAGQRRCKKSMHDGSLALFESENDAKRAVRRHPGTEVYMVEYYRKPQALSANHSEQVLEGWQLVPVEPTDAMLEAGDKYIGTPATYKAMLSACPSPAITKDFSQFLSAVMDAAGLIRHGRQSKELSEYLGMKCMEYRGAALSAPSHGGGVAHTDCRTEDGITVGLIDSIITSCRVLSSRDLTCEAVVEALRDLRSDSDVSLIKPSHGEQVRVPDVDLAIHLLSDRWPESSERIEVEVFAEWLRDLLAAAPSAGSQKERSE